MVWQTFDDNLVLYDRDRDILTSAGEWLNDNLISAAQQLIKKEYPYINGLQNPILQRSMTFEIMESKAFVQCLNLLNNHWLTISTLGCPPDTVRVYDSMNCSLSASMKKLIADLLHTASKAITIEYINVQQQRGGSDCGLFSIANAHTLCSGDDPVKCLYVQNEMRSHLLKALIDQKMNHFPSKPRKKVQNTVLRTSSIEIFCTCRIPDDGGRMVGCESCDEWFHEACVRVTAEELDDHEPWYCTKCLCN